MKTEPEILYESEQLLIVNKPEGVPSAKLPGSFSIEDWVCERNPGEQRLLANRLDTLTSGCLVFAKTEACFEELRSIWKTDAVRKFYTARVSGVPEFERLPHDIRIPIARLQKTSKRMKAILKPSYTVGIRGEPLEAHTRILSVTPIAGEVYSTLEIEIFTGVMHQIRVHLAAIGHPILGDPLYGKENPEGRMHLHSNRIVIRLASGEVADVRAKLKNAPESEPDFPG